MIVGYGVLGVLIGLVILLSLYPIIAMIGLALVIIILSSLLALLLGVVTLGEW